MDRRESLRHVGMLMGGTLSAGTIAGILGGCSAGSPAGGFAARALTEGRDEMVAVMAELIIPETDTPGARAAKVHEFIDAMLTDWYGTEERDRFLLGLAEVDERALASRGAAFMDLDEDGRHALLLELDAEAFGNAEPASGGEPPFFRTMKSLTLLGYYTSEIGGTQELRQMPMGAYRGDVPYDEIGRAWA